MKEIVLVRHGEPDLSMPFKISGKEIPEFLRRYNEAHLKRDSLPPAKLRFFAYNSTIFCSNLPRSLQSAEKCSVIPDVVNELFAESIPPHFQNDLFKLSPKTWLIFSRLMWLAGFSSNGESLTDAKKRAKNAANILINESKTARVLLFGHGLFNILIAKELRKRGFTGKRVPARRHWEFGVYRLL